MFNLTSLITHQQLPSAGGGMYILRWWMPLACVSIDFACCINGEVSDGFWFFYARRTLIIPLFPSFLFLVFSKFSKIFICLKIIIAVFMSKEEFAMQMDLQKCINPTLDSSDFTLFYKKLKESPMLNQEYIY